MKIQTKLTTVNVINSIYKIFKINTIENDLNFQKLVNRSLDLYNTNHEFKKIIDNHNITDINISKY